MAPQMRNPAPLGAGRASKAFCVVAERSEHSQIPGVNQASILGIDIGSKGAIALLTPNGELLDAVEMPCLHDGPAGRRNFNGPLLAEIIARAHASSAYVELVGARPGEGAVGAFAFGRSGGVVEGVPAALGIRVTHISPASWKRAIGIPVGREGAKDAALRSPPPMAKQGGLVRTQMRRWQSRSCSDRRRCLVAGGRPMSAPPALAHALDPLLFEEIEQSADRAASIWRSIAEASFRGDVMTVAVHLRQVRLLTFHVHELVKQFGSSSQEARAA